MPPRKRKKKAAAAKKEEGEEEPVEEAEAEEPAAGEEPALVHVVSSSEPAPAPAAPPLDAEVASLLASAREAVAAPQPSVAAAAPPQPSVVQAPPQPSYHAQLAQARAAPQSSYYPQQAQGSPEPLPGDDTNPTKLFVGGLSMVTCKEDLQEYFRQFSAVHDAVIQKHRMTKQSRGFGFVTVASRKAADRILGQKHVVQGRTLNVTNCKGENQGATGDVTGLTKLYVSDLRQHHTEQDLEVAFSRFGALREVVVMRHQETGEPRGFGFVTFAEHDQAKAAVASGFCNLGVDSARCKVVFASPRPPPRGGPRGPMMPPRGPPGYGYPPPQQGYAPPGQRQPPP